MRPAVLVVEDETALLTLLRYNLEKEGFTVSAAHDGEEALLQLKEAKPDAVLLDWMLPRVSGIEVCRQIRRTPAWRDLPVIMLTARGEEGDRVRGLDSGADDYVVKPFSPREVVARVQAMLRRADRLGASTGTGGRMTSGGLVLDAGQRTVRVDGQPVVLTRREFDLLGYLMAHPRRVFSKDQLMRRVWSWDFGDTSTVTVHVRRLRERIEADPADPRYVVTTRGVGYSFAADVVVD